MVRRHSVACLIEAVFALAWTTLLPAVGLAGAGATLECHLLGSGGTMPTPTRRLPSMVVRRGSRVFMFDCGEGTQIPYKDAHLGVRNLDVVAITHHHADHILGLPGILMLRSQMQDAKPLTVLGPPNVARFMENVRRDLDIYLSYPIEFRQWHPDAGPVAYQDDDVRILWHPLNHSVTCLGYRPEEHNRPGRFDSEAATRLGVPKGALWSDLQRGRSVDGPWGHITPNQVLGPTRRGRRIAYATDTAPTDGLAALLQGVDLAFVEGMYLPEHRADGATRKHLTVNQAAEAAASAEVDRLVLIHASPKYRKADIGRLAQIARELYPRAEVGRDGQIVDVELPSEDVGGAIAKDSR